MLYRENLYNIKSIHISEVKTGLVIANLGEILEIEEEKQFYNLVIARLNQKLVLKFKKNIFLMIVLVNKIDKYGRLNKRSFIKRPHPFQFP